MSEWVWLLILVLSLLAAMVYFHALRIAHLEREIQSLRRSCEGMLRLLTTPARDTDHLLE